MQVNRTPVGVGPESVGISRVRGRKELPAILKDLRNCRIALFFLRNMVASGTGVAERQAHLPWQLLLDRQVVIQHVRLLHMVVQKPQGLGGVREDQWKSQRRGRADGIKRSERRRGLRSDHKRDAKNANVVKFREAPADSGFAISPHIPGKAEPRAKVAQRHILEGRAQSRRSVTYNVPQSRLFAVLLTRHRDEFVAQTEVESETRQDAEIVVGVKTERVVMIGTVPQRTGRLRRIL